MPDIGPLELVIILVIVLIVVGPKKLPGLGRSLGSGMREFKDSLTGDNKDEQPVISPTQLPTQPVQPAPPQPVAEPVPLQKPATGEAPAPHPAPQAPAAPAPPAPQPPADPAAPPHSGEQ